MQLSLDFQPGLTTRFKRWKHTLANAVYSSRQGLSGVAADLDMSPSELSNRLSDEEGASNRPLRDEDCIAILRSTHDFTPIYWLIEEFLKDPDVKQQEALQQIPELVERLNNVLAAAGATNVKAMRR